jgi:hypothetical protein
MAVSHPLCSACGELLPSSHALQAHMSTVHPPQPCPVAGCKKILPSNAKGPLDDHLALVHKWCRWVRVRKLSFPSPSVSHCLF